MKVSKTLLVVYCMLIFCFHSHAEEKAQEGISTIDTSAYTPEILIERFPNLWQRAGEIVERKLQKERKKEDIPKLVEQKSIDSLAALWVGKKTKYDTTRAGEIDEKIRYELLYFENKRPLDVARGKYFLMPYRLNYICFSKISDPSPDLEPRDSRLAMKWQLSLQLPIIAAKNFNSGIFGAFTNRATFDNFNPKDSRPVTHKTFIPEAFGRLDLALFLPKKEVIADKYVLQAGYEHESNGGLDNSQSLLDSRGITGKIYGSADLKFFRSKPDEQIRYVYEDKYKLSLQPKFIVYIWGDEDNPDIEDYIGFFEFNGSYEQDLTINKTYCLGIIKLDWSLIPGGKMDLSRFTYALGLSYAFPMHGWTKNALKVPFTLYLRHFNGYNEYLYYYDKRRSNFQFGFRIRY